MPPGYGAHFQSFDGKERTLLVEGAGGPSWYTEYNVLTGLSARSYGRFADFVTRIAAGRVERGLPHTLRNCGYKTFTLYPVYGAFLSARNFQTTPGIEHFLDSEDARARNFLEPDASISTRPPTRSAKRDAARSRCSCLRLSRRKSFSLGLPLPPRSRARTGAIPATATDVDEYLRRQDMSARRLSGVRRSG